MQFPNFFIIPPPPPPQIRYNPRMTTPESPLQKFQALLGEMLQTEKSDLDFGIYRVIGRRRGEMEDFITRTIPDAVDQAVADAQPYNAAVKEKEELERQIRRDVGNNAFTPDGELRPDFAEGEAGKKWHEVCARAKGAQLLTAPDVCNRLLQFFGRYYHEGDFVSKRRYAGNAKYAVPYDGREVLLHWANRDQYYVKTADRFAQYAFTADNSAFQFRVEKTAVQKDNNQPPKGVFILAEARDENGRVIAVFHRRELSEENKEDIKPFAKNGGDQQAKIIALAEKQIKDGKFPLLRPLCDSHSTQKEKSRFAVHAARFVRRNTSDYFIHRNLRAFLRRELDFFLKNETINADELAENAIAENRIAAFRAVRNVARQIIDMLAQWEDFQKALWEKKKIILQTEYCATLGHIPEWENCDILDDIVKCEKQWTEWKELGMHGECSALFSANGKGKRAERVAFLRDNLSLPVDTAHFPPEFKDRLLAQFPNIDDATDGVLIHGDNWQVLNLIREMYHGQVKCVYIDPPYNTGGDGFLYRDQYQHSSWLTMMAERIANVCNFLPEDGVVFVSVDDNEQHRLRMMMDEIFGADDFVANLIWRKKAGGGMDSQYFAREHEYILCYRGNKEFRLNFRTIEFTEADFPKMKNERKCKFTKLEKWGSNAHREDRPTMFYAIQDPDGNDFYPQAPSGREGNWRTRPMELDKDHIHWEKKDGRWTPYEVSYFDELGDRKKVVKERTIFYDLATTTDATFDQKDLFSEKKFGDNKPVGLILRLISLAGSENSVILDFFAGSGTTAHAAIKLNQVDGKRRKFILAEMGDYFGTVLLPRVKKVIYSPEWRAGKAARPATAEECKRGPRLVKYHRIESYEDALDNVDFGADKTMRKLDDFIPRYMLRWESRKNPTFLSDEKLENPFDYKLQLSGEAARTERADLPETFAYLIGLRIQTRRVLTDEAGRSKPRYVVCRGECGGAEATAIWRDVAGWEEADYERDRKFVEENGLAAGRVWMNGNSLVPGASVLDAEFRERMFPPSVREDAE